MLRSGTIGLASGQGIGMSKLNHSGPFFFHYFKFFSKIHASLRSQSCYYALWSSYLVGKSLFYSPNLELLMTLNESFGFIRATIKRKHLYRLNKIFSFGLFNYFKSYNPSKYGYNHKRASSLHGFGGIIIIFLFFCLKGGFPTLP